MPSIATGPAISGSFDSERTVISKETPVAVPLPAAQLPPAEMGKLLEGQRLGHFDLREFVGGGGMGAVFRAHDTMLDRIVAVKVLSKLQSNDEETLRRFKNEAQSAARLDHDNIGRVHYVGEDQGWHYIVFEFIEGINLRELVDRDGPLPLGDALSYTLQVADALAHASERDVVHRDIKPSNVLITPGGRAKLVDMGLARLHQVEHSGNDLTASGVTLGTFDYISPEQARDPRNADVRSDIYSLGCTLYFMLTGRPPFPGGTVLQKLLQHQAEEPTDPRGLRTDLPEDVLRVLRRMLAKAPNQRYQQPAALMRDLIAVANKSGLPMPATISSLWPASNERRPRPLVRHLPWLAPVAVLLVASLIVAIVNQAGDADIRPAPIRHLPLTSSASQAQVADRELADTQAGRSGPQNAVQPANSENGSQVSGNASSKDVPSTDTDSGSRGAQDRSLKSETSSPNPVEPDNRTGSPGADQPSKGMDRVGSQASTNSSDSNPSASPAAAQRDSSNRSNSRFSLAGWLEDQFTSLATIARRASEMPATRPPAEFEKTGNRAASAVETPARPPTGPMASPFNRHSAEQNGVLLVTRSHEGPNEFGSLAEACRAAKSGEAIELRYNGALDSRPIYLTGQRLMIRAGDGFAPIVSFRPRETDLAQSHSMLVLGGGQLTMISVQLELAVSRQAVGESLTLGETRPGESIRLENCVLTIRNAADSGLAYQPDVAFFEIRAVPGAGVMTLKDGGPMMRPAAALQLKNCVARGEALFIRANDAQPAQIGWENGLFATSERFLTSLGGPSDPRPPGQIQIDLRHLTAFVAGGFVSLSATQDAPLQLPVEINASDCIFLTKKGAAAAPLVDQSGVEDPEDLRKRIAWNGDRNFYEGFSVFWRMAGPGGAETAVQMNLTDWQGFWGSHEVRPTADRVVWRQLPPADRAVNLHVPSGYALGSGDNAARAAASDGRDAGAEIDQLPVVKE